MNNPDLFLHDASICKMNYENKIDGLKLLKNIKDEVVKYGVVGWCFAGYLANTNQSKNIPNYANANGSIISTSDNEFFKKRV